MNQEDKELLFKDLCARLPYGIKVQVYDNRYAPTTLTAIDIKKQECIFNFNVPVENCLPYLRPISSMTEEELYEVQEILGKGVEIRDVFISIVDSSINTFSYLELQAVFEWFNAHHFDYRGLIERGLALEAPEGMYNIKEK